uniref:Chromo domain-containing protein n=1 Tax=Sander lucioperca TaxID=283035 RepID=A0A8C9Y1J3_SANLU
NMLSSVERVVDKRRNRKGKVEYLVRWRGYGAEGDTWEPESHLSTCTVYVHDFNRQQAERQRDATLLRSTRHCSPAHRAPYRPPPHAVTSSGTRWAGAPLPPPARTQELPAALCDTSSAPGGPLTPYVTSSMVTNLGVKMDSEF